MINNRTGLLQAYAALFQKRWPFLWATGLHWLPFVWAGLAAFSAVLLLTPYGAEYAWPETAEALPQYWADVFPYASWAGQALAAAPVILFLAWLPLMRYRYADVGVNKGTSTESWKRLGAVMLFWAPVVLICAAAIKLNNDAMRAVFTEALSARGFDPEKHLPYQWSLPQPAELLGGFVGALAPAAMCAFALTYVRFWELLIAVTVSYFSVIVAIFGGMAFLSVVARTGAPETTLTAIYALLLLGFCVYALASYRFRPNSGLNLARGPKYATGKYVALSILTILLCVASMGTPMLLDHAVRGGEDFMSIHFAFSTGGFAVAFHLFQKNLSLIASQPKL